MRIATNAPVGNRATRLVPLLYLLLLALASPAHAGFPGQNGKITFWSDETVTEWTVNPDGAGLTQLPGGGINPRWSPDGKKIVFGYGRITVINADGSGRIELRDGYEPDWSPDGTKIVYRVVYQCSCEGYSDIWVMNADGTNPTPVTSNQQHEGGPVWSPDGTRIAFWRQEPGTAIFTIKPDGTDEVRVTQSPPQTFDPEWSPDSSRIAFARRTGCTVNFNTCWWDIYSVARDGTGLTKLTNTPSSSLAVLSSPAWSPDGEKIAFEYHCVSGSGCSGYPEVWVSNIDGTGAHDIPGTPGWEDGPSWQPTFQGYVRPKGASPYQVQLVPAFKACTTPTRQHGGPLSYGSCLPQQASDYVTVGTADANGRATQSSGFIFEKPRFDNPGTPSVDETDLTLDLDLTDVRRKADLTDYTGELRVQHRIRLTDRQNNPYPGGAGPGTVMDFNWFYAVPCTATSETTIGARCLVSTTANSLVPGSVTAGKKAIWQISDVEVYDGGSDGLASTTADNTLFEVPGVFVP